MEQTFLLYYDTVNTYAWGILQGVRHYLPVILFVTGTALMYMGVSLLYKAKHLIWGWDSLMARRKTRKARNKYVRTILANRFTSALEDAVYAEELTRDEANKAYRDWAVQYGMWDLVGKRVCVIPDAEDVKARIKKDREERKRNGHSNVIPLPDADNRPKPKNIVDALVLKHLRKPA